MFELFLYLVLDTLFKWIRMSLDGFGWFLRCQKVVKKTTHLRVVFH